MPPSGSDIEFNRYQLSWVNRLQWDTARIGIGIDAEREEGDSVGYLDYGFLLPTSFELERDNIGVFAELYYEIGASFSVSGSMRYDDPDRLDSEVTTRLGALYRFAGGRTELRANWGEGFKLPSFFALAHPLVGNSALEPETSTSWDIGLEHQFQNGVSLNVVYFDNTYRNLIDFDDELFITVNRDRVENDGVEFNFKYELSDTNSLRVHATYLDINLVGNEGSLRGRPEWKAGMQWFHRIEHGISFSLDYMWVDNVVEASRHTGESRDYTLDAYSTLDLSLNWQAHPRLKLQAAVSNVLDEDYEQAVGFPAVGIYPRAGVKLAF